MKMNLSMSRQATKRTCYALISLLLVASLAFVVSPVNAKNGMANTNTMPESNKVTGTRMLMEESDKLMYSRIYVVVTEAADFIRLFPNGGDILIYLDDFLNKAQQANTFKSNPEFLIQGSSTTQKGAVFDSSSIEVVSALDGVVFTLITETGDGVDFQVQYAGNRKIKFTPVDDPSFFFHGQCIVTSGFLEPSTQIRIFTGLKTSIPQPVILSHSCSLNLCLGGGGFSCIAIYSGSAFVFNFGKGVALNNEAQLDPDASVFTFEAPPLPPPFPGTIIGGTGAFEGIEGSVTIATIAGTTGPIFSSDGKDIENPGSFFKLKPAGSGSIVQVITVKSNMPLPPGP